MDRPQRKFYLELEVGADDMKSLIQYLREIMETLESNVTQSVSGAPSFGGSFTLNINPEMTHDKYFELNDQWLATKT